MLKRFNIWDAQCRLEHAKEKLAEAQNVVDRIENELKGIKAEPAKQDPRLGARLYRR